MLLERALASEFLILIVKRNSEIDMGGVSEKYLLLMKKEVRRLALEITTESMFEFEEIRIFWDGTRCAHG